MPFIYLYIYIYILPFIELCYFVSYITGICYLEVIFHKRKRCSDFDVLFKSINLTSAWAIQGILSWYELLGLCVRHESVTLFQSLLYYYYSVYVTPKTIQFVICEDWWSVIFPMSMGVFRIEVISGFIVGRACPSGFNFLWQAI